MFIHPLCRTTLLHQSGLDILGEELIDAELVADMTGRAGRTESGLVFYLFEFDDSGEALPALEETRQQQRRSAARACRSLGSASQHISPRPSTSHPSHIRAPPRNEGMTQTNVHQKHATLVIPVATAIRESDSAALEREMLSRRVLGAHP